MSQIEIDTQELKSMAPIIQYVKTYYSDKVIIEKENENIAVAKCVFHEENTASLVFYSNGTYKCFGCGEHGDIITFVQQMENLDFQNACMLIANNVGYKIKEIQTNQDWEQYKDTMDNHTRRYWTNLQKNPDALNYMLNVRKITPEMINEFRLGLTDIDEYKYRQDIGNISNRIVFPILDNKIHPKCIGMAYRTLKDEKPKYINDHNQTGQNGQNIALRGVFIKGNCLYGLPQACKSIIKNDFVFVVEGYFDVIAMHQSGLTNTVGIMGTSFSENQIRSILGLTKNVFMLLDSDKAGKSSMNKYITELLKYGIRPMMCILDNYKDPDELCKSMNFKSYDITRYLQNLSEDGIHYIISSNTEKFRKMVSRERANIMSNVVPIIQSIPNPILRDAYLKELEKELLY